MKALVYNTDFDGHYNLVERDIPKILDPKDAIVEVTMSSICTSDLHIIHGQVPRANNNIVLGHEYVGRVVEVGADVKTLKIGDRVSANCETFCGECFFCKRGFINNCEKGGWEIGCRIDGCQAEYVRVPLADQSLDKLPDNVTDKNALFVGDILATGYFGAEMCEIQSEDTIAVIGCGPVGLCSMICAKVLGAKNIIAIDIEQSRLDLAKSQNLATYYINSKDCDIEKEIKKLTHNRGADKVIEAAGANNTFELSWKIARPNAIVAVVALYEEDQILPLPKMYGKNLTFKTGGIDAIHSNKLIDLISQGKINTDFLVTHTYKLENIMDAYETFKTKKDNCIKIAIEK
ncbi:alcohol dehydrogenase catalytic domain-containing protein [bacterium]|nr:alcohol dehydrogenase catalytic domain-containing protein [bacterium]